ncbi:DUF4145 domain-containing protein [Salegentibacter flavus]|uniref:DUF4145 domain-containing protein n=1 Tax=Salegentibacter flavus TaxID=287099 RepID=A0A1I4ZUE5_9FLAO|nr:DUF4145 domain-containing protein [Salegentibacter flavus]SFN53673.1 protein of unknown function [Salegentibacter flavus]
MLNEINRNSWVNFKFTPSKKPNWVCPNCGVCSLRFEDEWFKRKPNSVTAKENPKYFRNFPEKAKYQFTGFLNCENPSCRENVAVVGISGNFPEFSKRHTTYFIPKFFYPPLQIFPISEKCPKELEEHIRRSFSHYFNDPAAAANALRTAIEFIISEQGIAKFCEKGKLKSLHSRLEEFGRERPELSDFLIATKWVGNAGSHIEGVDINKLLDGYEFLQHCINEIYDKVERESELRAKAKEIINSQRRT